MKNNLLKKISIITAMALLIGGNFGFCGQTFKAKAAGKKMVVLVSSNLRGDLDKLKYISKLKKNYESDENTVVKLVDAGNYLQGTHYTAYDLGKEYIGLMSLAGFDAVGVGRYDVQFGDGITGSVTHGEETEYGSIGKHTSDNGLPLLTTGIKVDISENETDPYFSGGVESIVFKDGDFELGLYSIPSEDVINKSVLGNVTLMKSSDIIAEQSEKLKDNDVVLAVTTDNELKREDINLCKADEKDFSIKAVEINEETGSVEINRIDAGDNVDSVLEEKIEAFKKKVDSDYPSVYESKVTLNGLQKDVRSRETNLGDFWCDALRWFATSGEINNYFSEDAVNAGNNSVKVDEKNIVSVWNGGNLRAFLNEGDVINTDIYRILPYPNKVAIAYLTGEKLEELVESSSQNIVSDESSDPGFLSVSGLRYTLDAFKTYDKGEEYKAPYFKANSVNRTKITQVNGRPIEKNDIYAVITSNAIFNGMDSCYVMNDKLENSTVTTMLVRDVVMTYIEKGLKGRIDSYVNTDGRIMINYSAVNEQKDTDKDTKAVTDKSVGSVVSENGTSKKNSTSVKAPARVKIKSAKSKKKGRITLAWNKVKDVDGYEFYRVIKGNGKKKYKKIKTINNNKKSTVTISVKSKKTYSITVKAYKKYNGKKVYSKKYSKIVKIKAK